MSRKNWCGLLTLLLVLSATSQTAALTRDEALVRAQTYCFHPWTAATKNQSASCLGSYQSIYVPGDYLGLPYDWGGYVTLFQFDDGIQDGDGAGSYPEHGVLSCTVGLDCSGYVSKIWDVGHFGTATIHNVSHEISFGDVLPGDAFNVPSYHIVLFAGELSDGWPFFYEAIGYNTMYNPFAGWANVSGFTPIRLDTITGNAGSTPSGTAPNPINVKSFPYVHNGNTSNSTSDLFDYYGADTGKKESGPEVIYAVDIASPGTLTISVQDGAGVDIDVHLCSALESYHCIARNDSLIEMEISKCGLWYVVADTWVNASGTEFPGAYTLTLEFSPQGGTCGPNQPFDFVGGIGDPCGYPGNPALPFCNPNLGALTCLYSNADNYSFCTIPCGKNSDCQADFPGGCCVDVAGAGEAADFYCVTDDFCQPVVTPVDEGPDEPGEDVVVQPPADAVTQADVPGTTYDQSAPEAGGIPHDDGLAGGEAYWPGDDGATVEVDHEADSSGAIAPVGEVDASDDETDDNQKDGSCSASPATTDSGAGTMFLLLVLVLSLGLRRYGLRNVGRVWLVTFFFVLACSGSKSPGLDATSDGTATDGGLQDADSSGPEADVQNADLPGQDSVRAADSDVAMAAEVECVPSCVGRDCGADGCGGSCGECTGAAFACNAEGLCLTTACESSKDCPGDLVCHKDAGYCVECVASTDCEENQRCVATFECIDVVPCASDKDCKEVDGVCDKELAECVDCLSELDCPEAWFCIATTCIEPACQPNEVRCNGQAAEVCMEDQTGWDLVKACPDTQFCVGGKCLDHVCAPNSKFCDGTIAILCNGDGSGPVETTDCADAGLFCAAGECGDCQPECDGKECGDDACGGNCGVCPAGVPCVEDGGGWVCGSPCDIAELAGGSDGCEFWAVDLDNVEGGQYEPVALFVAVPPDNGDAELLVERFEGGAPIALIPGELDVPSLDLVAGTVATLILPTGMDVDGTGKTSVALRIRSSVPVTVHQFNPLNGNNVFTNDASLLLPQHLNGKEYFALSWPQRVSGYTLRGDVAIVATGPGDTYVQLWVTCSVKAGVGAGGWTGGNVEPYEVALKQGEVLNLETDGDQGADLTGSRVLASKDVAVFGAHECANIPLGTNYCDHIEQQLLPVDKLDKLYAGDAFAPRNAAQKDVWRVVAAKDDTQVALVPPISGPYVLNAGQWVEFYSGAPFVLEATKAVVVGHYLQGSNYSGFNTYPACTGGTGIGDPAFTIAVPLNNFRYGHRVLTPEGYNLNYLNIVGAVGPGTVVTVDGLQVETPFQPIGSSGYGIIQLPVPKGVHDVSSQGAPVGVTAYGYACDVSYAYPGGL